MLNSEDHRTKIDSPIHRNNCNKSPFETHGETAHTIGRNTTPDPPRVLGKGEWVLWTARGSKEDVCDILHPTRLSLQPPRRPRRPGVPPLRPTTPASRRRAVPPATRTSPPATERKSRRPGAPPRRRRRAARRGARDRTSTDHAAPSPLPEFGQAVRRRAPTALPPSATAPTADTRYRDTFPSADAPGAGGAGRVHPCPTPVVCFIESVPVRTLVSVTGGVQN